MRSSYTEGVIDLGYTRQEFKANTSPLYDEFGEKIIEQFFPVDALDGLGDDAPTQYDEDFNYFDGKDIH